MKNIGYIFICVCFIQQAVGQHYIEKSVETSSKNIRVICPIITHPDIENGFRQNKNEEIHHLPATGHYYTFDDHRIEHAVFNKSNIDRYALVFTVINVDNLKEWERKYKKNKMFWKAWSNGM